MFRPSKVISEAFVKRVTGNYRKCFGEGPPGHLETLTLAARMSLSRLARTNALYHNMDHTMMVSLVGEAIIRGRVYRDGDVRSIDWLHFMVALFSFGLGFTRNLCRGDSGALCVIDACVQSMRAQNHPDAEFIFVLDRCTDQTAAIVAGVLREVAE